MYWVFLLTRVFDPDPDGEFRSQIRIQGQENEEKCILYFFK
jgi:hypothetical protein